MSFIWAVTGPPTDAVWGLAVNNGGFFFFFNFASLGGRFSHYKSHMKSSSQRGDETTTFIVSALRTDAGGSRLGHKTKGQTLKRRPFAACDWLLLDKRNFRRHIFGLLSLPPLSFFSSEVLHE